MAAKTQRQYCVHCELLSQGIGQVCAPTQLVSRKKNMQNKKKQQ